MSSERLLKKAQKIVLENVYTWANNTVNSLLEHEVVFLENDSNYFEVLEKDEDLEIQGWYAVSDWLAGRLKEFDEVVLEVFGELYFWGRQEAGQPIYLDKVIQDIARFY